MKNKIKTLALLLALVLALSCLTACGSKDSNPAGSKDSESASNKTADESLAAVQGNVISARIPEGWILVPGAEIETVGYLDEADYIFKGTEVNDSAPMLMIGEFYTGDLETYKEYIEGGSFGDPIDPFTVNDLTWYAGKEGAVTQLGDKLCFVYPLNGADFSDETVQTILGTIDWAK